MAGNFGGKIFWRIAENMSFAGIILAVEPVLAIMIFITKWLIERAENLTSYELVLAQLHRAKLMMKCN